MTGTSAKRSSPGIVDAGVSASTDPAAAGKRASPAEAAQAGVLRVRAGFAVAGGLLLTLAAAFAATAAAPAHPLTLGADHRWLVMIRHAREPVLTSVAKVVSLAGGPSGSTVIVIAVAAFLWFVRKRPAGALFLAGTLVATSGAGLLIKHLVLRPRPPGALVSADVGSFPSGHVITTLAVGVALAMVLARPSRRPIPLLLAGAATLVMIWCRTYLGAHWLSDTLESIFVAGGLVLAGWAFAGTFVERERQARA